MTDFLTDCVFVGTEAEGPDRGKKTLFIASRDINPLELQRYIFKECHDHLNSPIWYPLPRIYFGAGGNYGLSKAYFPLVRSLLDAGFPVIVEVGTAQQIRIIPEDIKKLARFEIVLVFTKVGPKIHKDFCTVLPYVRHFKFVDAERVFWSPKMYQSYITFLNDLTYKDDREVEI
jgi:hypothetical protein